MTAQSCVSGKSWRVCRRRKSIKAVQVKLRSPTSPDTESCMLVHHVASFGIVVVELVSDVAIVVVSVIVFQVAVVVVKVEAIGNMIVVVGMDAVLLNNGYWIIIKSFRLGHEITTYLAGTVEHRSK